MYVRGAGGNLRPYRNPTNVSKRPTNVCVRPTHLESIRGIRHRVHEGDRGHDGKRVDTDSTQERPRRRFYSAELKTRVLEKCRQAGASVAGVALSHNINPNIVHPWIREQHQRTLVAQAELATGAFMPLQLQAAPVVEGNAKAVLTQARADTHGADIRIEVRRSTGTVTVNWPLEGAESCAAWLRDWLR